MTAGSGPSCLAPSSTHHQNSFLRATLRKFAASPFDVMYASQACKELDSILRPVMVHLLLKLCCSCPVSPAESRRASFGYFIDHQDFDVLSRSWGDIRCNRLLEGPRRHLKCVPFFQGSWQHSLPTFGDFRVSGDSVHGAKWHLKLSAVYGGSTKKGFVVCGSSVNPREYCLDTLVSTRRVLVWKKSKSGKQSTKPVKWFLKVPAWCSSRGARWALFASAARPVVVEACTKIFEGLDWEIDPETKHMVASVLNHAAPAGPSQWSSSLTIGRSFSARAFLQREHTRSKFHHN